jgi:hypothetical protein
MGAFLIIPPPPGIRSKKIPELLKLRDLKLVAGTGFEPVTFRL